MKLILRILISSFLISAFVSAPFNTTNAQVLKKLKEKAIDKMLGNDNKQEETTATENKTTGTAKGKKLTPPDVKMHIGEATAALNTQNYSGAKFNIQQAMVGIELEIGYAILDAAPKSVNGTDYIPEEDQVTSTGIGFVGLVVGRAYKGNKKNMSFAVMNNSALVGTYGVLMTNASYSSSEGDQKAISLDGNRGIIKYENGDYEVGVPLGTNSIFILNCEGCADENEVMNAARLFKVNDIKKMLGEQ